MREFVLLISLLMFSSVLSGQKTEKPVKWAFEFEKISDTSYKVTATGTIKKGWFVYSPFTNPDGPVPTEINYTDGIEATGPIVEDCDVITGHDDLFDMTVSKIKDKAVFTQTVNLVTETDILIGQLRYMACDMSRCLPPTIVEFQHEVN